MAGHGAYGVLQKCRASVVTRSHQPPLLSLLQVFELCDTDLLSIVESHGQLDEPSAHTVFTQVAAGLAHCHTHGVWHLDVKPDNVLVAGGVVKVADFGCASTQRMTSVRSGTAEYAAPEVRGT